jgi:hypothetical protein
MRVEQGASLLPVKLPVMLMQLPSIEQQQGTSSGLDCCGMNASTPSTGWGKGTWHTMDLRALQGGISEQLQSSCSTLLPLAPAHSWVT